MEQALEHLSSKPSEAPSEAIQRYLHSKEEPRNSPESTVKYIPLAGKLPHAANAPVHIALAFLIAQWTEDSILQTAVPHTIISVTRDDVEKQWGVCLSERELRHCSNQRAWVRIELQGIYDLGGTWVAGIQGQSIDTPVFRVIVPAGTQVGYAVIQRAMLHSLNQGLTVQVQATPSIPTAVRGEDMRLDIIHPHGPEPFVKEPIPPKELGHSSDWYSYESRNYREQYAVYKNNLETYKTSAYWKLPAVDMHRSINS